MEDNIFIERFHSFFEFVVKPKALPMGFLDPGCGEKEELEVLLGRDVDELDDDVLSRAGTAWQYFDSTYVNYYLPGIIWVSYKNLTGNHPLIVDDIFSEILMEYDVNGLTYDFKKKWEGLNIAQLELVEEWLVELLKGKPREVSKIKAVLSRMKAMT